MMKTILVAFAVLLTGCVGLPENVKPVEQFNADRYLGKWYEIARLDHSFERGLSKVSATYSLRDDGGIRVINRGYDEKKQQWKEAEGKAYFVNGADRAYLKVSFFGPFYGSYIVADLDHVHYQYALVSGPDKSYLWILSRTPQMNQETQKRLVEKAATLGFDTGKLIFVEH
ncbi:MAG TPA: lipocalin family protein [Gammaproteobacteria bacterium]|nr:lipocalin family protein [Gammaproteobacteria bacterium]